MNYSRIIKLCEIHLQQVGINLYFHSFLLSFILHTFQCIIRIIRWSPFTFRGAFEKLLTHTMPRTYYHQFWSCRERCENEITSLQADRRSNCFPSKCRLLSYHYDLQFPFYLIKRILLVSFVRLISLPYSPFFSSLGNIQITGNILFNIDFQLPWRREKL